MCPGGDSDRLVCLGARSDVHFCAPLLHTVFSSLFIGIVVVQDWAYSRVRGKHFVPVVEAFRARPRTQEYKII